MQNSSPVLRRRWVGPLALAAMIFVASSRSVIAGPSIRFADKVTHFAVYGLLATLIVRAFLEQNGKWTRHAAWLSILLASAYGVSDEWHQSFTPGRAVEVADWLADTFGAALAVMLYCRWQRYRSWLEIPLFRRRKPRLDHASLAGPVSAP